MILNQYLILKYSTLQNKETKIGLFYINILNMGKIQIYKPRETIKKLYSYRTKKNNTHQQ